MCAKGVFTGRLPIISSTKRHNLNTWAYLRDILIRLADIKPGELEKLPPDCWQDSQAKPA